MNVIERKGEIRIILALCYYLSIDHIIFFINSITVPIIGPNSVDTIIVYLIFIVLFFRLLVYLKNRLVLSALFIILAVAICTVIGYTVYPSAYSIELLFRVVFASFFGILLITAVSDYKLLKYNLLKFARYTSIMMLVGFLMNQYVLKTVWSTNKMPFSYMLLMPVLGELWRIKGGFSLISCTLVSINLIIMLLFGSRGPLLCLIVYILLSFITNRDKRRVLIIGVMLILSLIIVLFSYNNIVWSLYNLGLKFGVRSKTLYLILEDNLLFDNGRNLISSMTLQLIKKSPLIGNGMFADRFYFAGGFVHNIFLEIILDFGIIIGTIIIFLLIRNMYQALKSREQIIREITVFLIAIGFVKLFVSSSFWVEKEFFVLVGFCVIQKNQNKILPRLE